MSHPPVLGSTTSLGRDHLATRLRHQLPGIAYESETHPAFANAQRRHHS